MRVHEMRDNMKRRGARDEGRLTPSALTGADPARHERMYMKKVRTLSWKQNRLHANYTNEHDANGALCQFWREPIPTQIYAFAIRALLSLSLCTPPSVFYLLSLLPLPQSHYQTHCSIASDSLRVSFNVKHAITGTSTAASLH